MLGSFPPLEDPPELSIRLAAIQDAWYELEPLEDIVARFIRAHPQDFFA